MKLSLAENIRSFRKQKKMTQEKLAEALGVTVGAVYKWESGLSQPELGMLVELADFFDVSVDVLLGYKMKDNRLDSTLSRLMELCQSLDPEAITEAEKAIARFPHSFLIVYGCANVYLAFGTSKNDRAYLRRALELLQESLVLLPQNTEPRINETSINGDMSLALFLLNRQEEGLELLKKNNANEIFSGKIGLMLAIFMNRPEEASDYLTEALLNCTCELINIIGAYLFIFKAKKDWRSALDITTWGIGLLEGLKTEGDSDFMDKFSAELQAMLSFAQLRSGMAEEAEASLLKAKVYALRFDSSPDYRVTSLRFTDRKATGMLFDVFGDTAVSSLGRIIELLEDRELSENWREIMGHEDCTEKR